MRKQSQQVTEILHTHRNQARYFAVFLMLSALVISFVCSALMMPAASVPPSSTVWAAFWCSAPAWHWLPRRE